MTTQEESVRTRLEDRPATSDRLTLCQLGIWLALQRSSQPAEWDIAQYLDIAGPIDHVLLETALEIVHSQAESLRLTFHETAGEPRQFAEHKRNNYCYLDFSREKDPIGVAEQWMAIERSQRNTDAGNFLVTALLKVGPERYFFYSRGSHLIFDGASASFILQRLAEIYNHVALGEPVAEKPSGTWRDALALEDDYLKSGAFERDRAYWRDSLADLPEVATLSGQAPAIGAAALSRRGILSADQDRKLRAAAERLNVTLPQLVTGAAALYLARLTGQRDLILGIPMANRPRAAASIVAPLSQVLPLRVRVSEDTTLALFFQEVGRGCRNVLRHQRYPMQHLRRDLNLGIGVVDLHGLQVNYLPFVTEIRFGKEMGRQCLLSLGPVSELAIQISDRNAERPLEIRLDANANHYDEAALERHLERFTGFLARLDEFPPETPLFAIGAMTAEELARIQRFSRGPETEVPGVSLVNEIREQARKTPDAVAVAMEDRQLSYHALDEYSDKLARYLERMGVGTEARVGVCLDRSIEMVIALLGVVKCGAAYVPLDPTYPSDRLRFMLADAQMAAVISHSALQEKLAAPEGASGTPVCPNPIFLDRDWQAIAAEEAGPGNRALHPDQLIYVIFTSGSTGRPKGAMNSHRALLNRIQWMQHEYRLTGEDVVLQKTPFSFDVSVWEFFWPLTVGARLAMAVPEGHKDPRYLADTIGRQNVTTLHFVPSMLESFLSALPAQELNACQTLTRVICSGEALAPELAQRCLRALSAELHNLYGPTEAAVDVSCWPCERTRDLSKIPIGHPIENLELYVVDEELRPVPIGVEGELLIGGMGLGRGYLNRPALTAERFIPHFLTERAGQRLYRTGDRACWREDGEIEYRGRFDDQIKLRGFRIETGEIEAQLTALEGVRQAAVILRENAAGVKQLTAYYTGGELPERRLRQALREHLPEYMIPARFVWLAELPLSPNGKLSRRQLPAPLETGGEEQSAPLTPAQESLAEIWRELLGRRNISARDDFFETGGHSLLATQMVSRVRQTFGVELPLHAVFETPVLEDLAAVIGRRQDAGLKNGFEAASEFADSVPLSFAQRRLWTIHQIDPTATVYHVAAAISIDGAVQLDKLQRAFEFVAQRHSILRSIVKPDESGEPFLRVHYDRLPVAPVREIRPEDLAQSLREAAWQPFDLEEGPLFRIAVFRLGAEKHVLAMSMHHLISDGWSIGILTREISERYNEQVAGAGRTELPAALSDRALWQSKALGADVFAKQLQYWRSQLEETETAALPYDFPANRAARHPAQVLTLTLPGTLHEGLRDLAKRERCTLFHALLAGWQIVVGRYGLSRDVCVGTAVAGRTSVETESLVSFFVNTLVMRGRWRDADTFADFLQETRRTVLDAYQNQDVPFDLLTDEMRAAGGGRALFQTMLVLQNAPANDLRIGGAAVRVDEIPNAHAKFDLGLVVREEGGGLRVDAEYASDLFLPESIQRMLGCWQQVLTEMVRDARTPIGELSLGTPADGRRIANWNRTGESFAESTLGEAFGRQAGLTPDAIAVVFEDQQISYEELDRRSNQLARYLLGCGAGPEARVGLCLERGIDLIAGLLGILKAGAAYVPLDPRYPAQRLQYLVEDSRLALVVTAAQFQHLFAGSERQVWLDREWPALLKMECGPLPPRAPAHSLAYVIYTSGSSGLPKGVEVEHRSVVNLAYAQGRSFGLGTDDAILQFASFSFDAAVWDWALALLHGSTLVMGERDKLMPGGGLEERLAAHNVTLSSLSPGVLGSIEDLSCLRGLRTLISSAEACPAELAARVGAQALLRNEYGPTEATVCVTLSDPLAEGGAPIGRPLSNASLYVVDEWDRSVPVGMPGELLIGGECLARGYAMRPALTAERFVPNPFGAGRLYRTGDLVRWRWDGQLDYLRRADEQLKLRGFRVESGEIEAALLRVKGVRQAAVLLREDRPRQKQLVAYLVSDTAESLADDAELRQELLRFLPDYMIPAAFVRLDALPLTEHGKLKRSALPAPGRKAETPERGATEKERILLDVWRQVLGQTEIGLDENFFELGGDSLLSVRVAAKAKEAGVALTPQQLFEFPTIAELARQAPAPNAAKPAPQEALSGAAPLTAIQTWFFEQRRANPNHFNQAVVLELAQPLDPLHLQKALDALIRHHDMLRASFPERGTPWIQAQVNDAPLKIVDLGAGGAPEFQVAARAAQTSLDIAAGKLLRAVYCKRHTRDVLLIVIHHLAVDGLSWQILLEDLAAAYRQSEAGQSVSLPAKTNSYPQWAAAQVEAARSAAIQSERSYWAALADAPLLPRDGWHEPNLTRDEESIGFEWSAAETEALLRQTHLGFEVQDVLLYALTQGLFAFAEADRARIDIETHGRHAEAIPGVDVSRTVGWFTSIHPVSFERVSGGAPAEIEAVRQQRQAAPHHGIGFGLLRDLAKAEELAAVRAEVLFNFLGQIDAGAAEAGALWKLSEWSAGPPADERAARTHILEVSALIVEKRLRFRILYSNKLHRPRTIERLARTIEDALRSALAAGAGTEKADSELSEFELAELLAANEGFLD